MMLQKNLLILSMSVLLCACGAGNDGSGGSGPGVNAKSDPTVVDIQVSQATSAMDERLACYQGNGEAACNLRIYQVMVESFIDADSTADYGTGYGTSHHDGDIAGVTASLDYIKSLGMNAVWLTPVFESIARGHQDQWADRLDATGYFTSDYFSIDPNFGTLEQARELVEMAHAKGLYVFFDGVFGHHKGDVVASPQGRTPTNGTAQGQAGFEAQYPADLEFYKEVAAYWVNELKIDGWRLDQAYQVPVNYWDDIRRAVAEASATQSYRFNGEMVNPLGYMVAEIWKSAGQITSQGFGFQTAPALESAFDFPLRYAVLKTFAVEESGNGNLAATTLKTGYFNHLAYPPHAMPNLMLGNHDLPRFGDLLQRGNLANPGDGEYWQRHKGALSFMAAYSGPITLYYGDEIGDELANYADRLNPCSGDSGRCDDHVSRTSAKIEGIATTLGAAETVLNAQQADLKAYVSSLMAMRAAHPALYNGARTHIHSDANVYIDRKDAGTDHLLYLVNTKGTDASINLTGTAIGSDGDLINLLVAEDIVTLIDDQYEITLPAYGAAFYQITSPTSAGPKIGVIGSPVGSGPLANCNAADVAGADPLGKDMWIRGSYQGGGNFGNTPDDHRFHYKGNNLYQVVVSEPSATAFTFKFASGDWSSEFAVKNSASVNVGEEQAMAVAIGHGTESNIVIPSAGDYVYSFKINAGLNDGTMMVSLCE